MKEALCRAFCNEIQVREVPAGTAVRTPFNGIGGEPIGFYIVGPEPGGVYRIEDDGGTIPLIEAMVADLESQTRAAALEELLGEYNVAYDDDRGELKTPPLREEDLPTAALKFSALLLRLQDLVLLTPERAASTFKEDAINQIKETLGEQATIRENEQIAPGVEFPADVIVQASGRNPVAIFLAMTEQRVLEAVVAQMAIIYEAHVPCSVIALLDKDTSVAKKMRRYASNRLVAMPIFEGDERAAIHRIAREVLGSNPTVH